MKLNLNQTVRALLLTIVIGHGMCLGIGESYWIY